MEVNNTNQTQVVVESIRKTTSSNLKAFASIRIEGILIKDCRVIQNHQGGLFVMPPQNSYEKNGGRIYYNIVEFPYLLKELISRRVLEAYHDN